MLHKYVYIRFNLEAADAQSRVLRTPTRGRAGRCARSVHVGLRRTAVLRHEVRTGQLGRRRSEAIVFLELSVCTLEIRTFDPYQSALPTLSRVLLRNG